VLLTLQVASFDQRFGAGLVKDRYLFYALPIVLVAIAAAVRSRRWPRWSLLAPAVVCAVGFATMPLPTYEKLNVDSPMSMLNDEILRLATSETWAHVLLALATVVAAALLVEAAVFLPGLALAIPVVALLTLVLPSQAVYAFDRLFAVNGTNGLPVTLDQGGVFNWVDRTVGRDGRVTMIRSPANDQDYWAGVAYWWDAEFWNESVVDDEVSFITGPGSEPWTGGFDMRTGAMAAPGETGYLLVHGGDVRVRLAGRNVTYERGAYLVDLDHPWRAAWLTTGIYGDGWTRPHTPAAIRVFAEPGQRTPVRRFVTLAIASPDESRDRPVTITSNLRRLGAMIPPNVSIDRQISLCVPPGAYEQVEIETPFVSDVYRDPTLAPLTGEIDRPAGVRIRSVALADEIEPMDRCPNGPPDQTAP
jgi:hypothetical protein